MPADAAPSRRPAQDETPPRGLPAAERTRPPRDPRHYVNRELSWLAFNRRVLEEAQDPRNPLLERCKFLAIVSSNLDEFTMVRYAELRAFAKGPAAPADYLGDPAADLAEVRAQVRALVADQYRCWREDLHPQLARERGAVVPPASWSELDRETLRRFYHDKLEPALTPLAVDPGRPFPLVANRGLVAAVALAPEEGGRPGYALVSVPNVARLIALVGPTGGYALAEDVVLTFLDSLFPGYRATSRCLLRTTRDGSLDIDEEQATDLLSEIEEGLTSREHGAAVRLELQVGTDPALAAWLNEALALEDGDVVTLDGPLDLTCLHQLCDRLNRPELRDPPFPVQQRPEAGAWADPFAWLRGRELLLHHPYESFQPVVDLVAAAAADDRVLAIKQTLYRVSGDSPIVRALMRAAKAGKQVTVLIELKARFDEAQNIRWAKRLEEAGAHVIYGLVGLKVHAKLLLIIRRDEDGIRRYCHLGTGNYNDRTARLYTDLSYFTSNEAVGRDVGGLFNMLTGYSRPPAWERLAVAPLSLREAFVGWIRREARNAAEGRGGRIVAKFNSLVDLDICDELYAASRAGVDIDLIVRGMCVLRPGVPGVSERIRVRSLVGRFLEHHRIYWFANQGPTGPDPVVAISSADWMTRNLDRRVECLVRIEERPLQRRLQRLLDIYLADNVQARVLQSDGVYRRMRPAPGEPVRDAVELLRAEAAAEAGPAEETTGLQFTPQRPGGR